MEQSSPTPTPLEPIHKCRKCDQTKPASEFARRSTKQGFVLNWCKLCTNACKKKARAEKRRKATNECIRRIRRGTDSSKAEQLVRNAQKAAGGGARKFWQHVNEQLLSDDFGKALRMADGLLRTTVCLAQQD